MILPMIAVRDYDASVKFYTEQLGFTSVMTMKGPDGKNLFGFVTLNGTQIGMGIDAALTDTQAKYLGTGVDLMIYPDSFDIDAYYEQVKSKGIIPTKELKTEYWGDRVFTVLDLDGYNLTFGKTIQTIPLDEIQAHMNQSQS